MSDYMPKPISRQRLDETVRTWGRNMPSVDRVERGPVIDQDTLEELIQTMGSDAGLLFETFLSDSAVRVAAIRAAASNCDGVRLELELHSLSGAAGTMGLPSLVIACEQLRKAVGQATLPPPQHLVDRIDSALDEARDALLSCALAA